MKVLVVDDSLMDRKLLCNLINKRLGLEPNDILQASNGEEGLKILSENFQDIRLILLDWQMPIMDGIDFMKGLVKVPEVATIPVVMITASGSDDNKKLAHEVNPKLAGYVVKPYNSEKLMELLNPLVCK